MKRAAVAAVLVAAVSVAVAGWFLSRPTGEPGASRRDRGETASSTTVTAPSGAPLPSREMAVATADYLRERADLLDPLVDTAAEVAAADAAACPMTLADLGTRVGDPAAVADAARVVPDGSLADALGATQLALANTVAPCTQAGAVVDPDWHQQLQSALEKVRERTDEITEAAW